MNFVPSVVGDLWFPADKGLRRVLSAALLFKAAIFATIGLGCLFFPFQAANFAANFHWPPGAAPGWTAHFKTWDAQHYLFLATQGYGPLRQSDAFYPLFPLLIRAFRPLLGGSGLGAGLLLSNLLSLAALVYIFSWARKKYGERTAVLSCLFLLAFPTAFYLDLVYAESLFLALAAAFFFYLEEGKAGRASLCAFLLPLARPTGILVLVPALVYLLFKGDDLPPRRQDAKGKLEDGRAKTEKNGPGKGGEAWARIFVPMAFVAGFGFYLAWMKLSTGDPWAGFHAQRFFTSGYGVSTLFHPIRWFMTNFVNLHYTWMGFGTGLLDRSFLLLFLVTAAWGFRRLEGPYFLYAVVLSLVPALSGNLSSYCRYWVVLFPLFTVLALKFERRPAWVLALSLPLQGVLALAHSLNYWVG